MLVLLVIAAGMLVGAFVLGPYTLSRPHEVFREWRLKEWTEQEQEMYWRMKAAQAEICEDP